MKRTNGRDHGGALDAAVARWGGDRGEWLDLSTGINPVPYPVPPLPPEIWTALPDAGAVARLEATARRFWRVPDGASVLAAPGASALIARLPATRPAGRVRIPGPTYNEHAAAFRASGWDVVEEAEGEAEAAVAVHPNNPDGGLRGREALGAPLTIIDESFADTMPEVSLVAHANRPGTVILKSFGKFWGLAGLRLGVAIGDPEILGPLAEMLGPWPVSGPALAIGARALADTRWAEQTRSRCASDADRLDTAMGRAGARPRGGTTLFRLYEVVDATAWEAHLAHHRILCRRFSYAPRWLRLGLPAPDAFDRVEAALAEVP